MKARIFGCLAAAAVLLGLAHPVGEQRWDPQLVDRFAG